MNSVYKLLGFVFLGILGAFAALYYFLHFDYSPSAKTFDIKVEVDSNLGVSSLLVRAGVADSIRILNTGGFWKGNFVLDGGPVLNLSVPENSDELEFTGFDVKGHMIFSELVSISSIASSEKNGFTILIKEGDDRVVVEMRKNE